MYYVVDMKITFLKMGTGTWRYNSRNKKIYLYPITIYGTHWPNLVFLNTVQSAWLYCFENDTNVIGETDVYIFM